MKEVSLYQMMLQVAPLNNVFATKMSLTNLVKLQLVSMVLVVVKPLFHYLHTKSVQNKPIQFKLIKQKYSVFENIAILK